jgi:hypothetical protein
MLRCLSQSDLIPQPNPNPGYILIVSTDLHWNLSHLIEMFDVAIWVGRAGSSGDLPPSDDAQSDGGRQLTDRLLFAVYCFCFVGCCFRSVVYCLSIVVCDFLSLWGALSSKTEKRGDDSLKMIPFDQNLVLGCRAPRAQKCRNGYCHRDFWVLPQ